MEISTGENNSLTPATAEADAAANQKNYPPLIRGWMELPRGQQVSIILVIALTAAVIVAAVLWSQRVEFANLFREIPEKEAAEIIEALQKMNVPYRIQPENGGIAVPEDKVHEVRLKLAGLGLPKESTAGFELMEKDTGLGMSQLMEGARYQRALEGEIARSIMTIKGVKLARVHLALPKESVFVRQPKKPSASVVIDLKSGRALEPGQVEAIVHLVSASVYQLDPSQISVVDQKGRLLFSRDNFNESALNAKQMEQQFDFRRQLEEHLIERIENILSPVVGTQGMRTQVTADVDFTVTERTQELYNPDMPALRSEQTSEEQSRNNTAQGVPGALSNQPPAAGTAPEEAKKPGGQGGTDQAGNATRSATRNYELDKTISHSRLGTGVLRRLTVAVVVDNQHLFLPDGTTNIQAWSEEDITRFSNLVKEAVGYDPVRGDRVTVTNAAFRGEEIEPPPPIWEQPWFWNLIKAVLAVLMMLVIVFAVLRPIIKGLVGKGVETEKAEAELAAAQAAAELRQAELTQEGGADSKVLGLAVADDLLMLESPQSYEKRLEFVQKLIDQDSARVAQVLKKWLNTDA
ncbi:MAG: flagellar basal-body MS-ring/collar protein FliF [Methylococcaceae bacterium]